MTNIHKTRAGIDWMRQPTFATIKCALGEWVNGRGLGTAGLFTQHTKKFLEEYVCDTAPWARDEFNELSTHRDGFGHALAHRARYCLPKALGGKDESQAFLQPEFAATHQLVTSSFGKITLHRDDVAAVQEQRIKMLMNGRPGVYVRVHPERPEEGYIGHGRDAFERGYQTSSPHRIMLGFVTLDKRAAMSLDEMLHKHIDMLQLARRPRGPHTRGLVIANCGSILAMVSTLAPNLKFFYNTIVGRWP